MQEKAGENLYSVENTPTGVRIMSNYGNDWLTLREAGRVVGKSSDAIRMWIQRKIKKNSDVKVKKEQNETGEFWVIHRDEVIRMASHERRDIVRNMILEEYSRTLNKRDEAKLTRETSTDSSITEADADRPVDTVSDETYKQKNEAWKVEREDLYQEARMYQNRYENLEKQVKNLGIPIDDISRELNAKNEMIDQLRQKLELMESMTLKDDTLTLSEVEDHKDNLKDSQEQTSSLTNDTEEINTEILLRDARIQEMETLLIETREQAEDVRERLRSTIEQLKETGDQLRKTDERLKENEELLSQTRNQLKEERDIRSREAETYLNELEELENRNRASRITEVSQDSVEKLLLEIETKNSEIQQLRDKIAVLNDEFSQERSTLLTEISEIRAARDQALHQIQETRNDQPIAMPKAAESIEGDERIQELQKELETLRDLNDELQLAKHSGDEQVEEIRNLLERTKQEAEEQLQHVREEAHLSLMMEKSEEATPEHLLGSSEETKDLRSKLETLERRLKLLPGPIEEVATEIELRNSKIQSLEQKITEMAEKLQKEQSHRRNLDYEVENLREEIEHLTKKKDSFTGALAKDRGRSVRSEGNEEESDKNSLPWWKKLGLG